VQDEPRQAALDAISAAFPDEPLDAETAFGLGASTYLDRDEVVAASHGRS
jgi:hypothetical protein